MVHKIKKLLLCILLFVLTFVAITIKGDTETNLLKMLLPAEIVNSTDIVPIADKSASIIKVVLEAENETSLEELKNNFISSIDTQYFEINNPDVSGLLKKYLSSPTNFISNPTRKLLKSQKYDELFTQRVAELYNPAGIQLSPIDQDPYLLFDDFITQNLKILKNNDRCFTLKLKSQNGLAPDLSNKKLSEIIKIQQKLSKGNSKIYLAGSPIHSYHTSTNSVISINIICLLSTILVLCLTYCYFKNIKILIPISLSIICGMLTGYIATKLWFDNFQILTMVFSTTLIGIGIDYSYHYCFAKKIDKHFIKNLSISLITTLIPFVLLYATQIELLKQIAVFTVFGLSTIYLFVLIFYPCFDFPKPQKTLNFPLKIYQKLLVIFLAAGVIGFINLHFNDSLTTLYTPSKKLLNAEKLYNQLSGDFTKDTQIITVKGANLNEILEKEEIITQNLTDSNIDYISLSKFIPSPTKQKENFNLVKALYNSNLSNYEFILSKKQMANLKKKPFMPVNFEIKDFPYLSEFLLTPQTSLIFAFSDKKIEGYANVVNLKFDIQKYMKNYREKLLTILPLTILAVALILCLLYRFKKGLKLLLPPCIGIFVAAGITSLLLGELNLFSIIAMFLVFGFTMDYSIFRTQQEKHIEDAIFISSLTTSFSFLLLSITGFKLLSSISFVLFSGILVSYLSGYVMNNSVVQSTYENSQTKK